MEKSEPDAVKAAIYKIFPLEVWFCVNDAIPDGTAYLVPRREEGESDRAFARRCAIIKNLCVSPQNPPQGGSADKKHGG